MRASGEPSSNKRDVIALAGAVAAHALILVYVSTTPTKRMFHDSPRDAVDVEIVARREVPPRPPVEEPPPAPPPVEEPPRHVETPPSTEPPPTTTAPPPPTTAPVEDTAHAPIPTTAPTTVEPSKTGESVVRLPKNDGVIGRVLGTGGALGPSARTLEKSLDIRAEGPMSDAKHAASNARKFLETDLADDAVTAGLADDYFRNLKGRVETNWRPAMKELNDGGESVTQMGMLKDIVSDDGRAAWDEMMRAYLDLAGQYARGQTPQLDQKRKERIRELMRSRKGAFRFHAITEAVLTQGPDGKVLTIEMPLTSGHPGIDEGVKDAIATAVAAMVNPPPARVHHGRSFTSTWRLRATWVMVPPTAFLTGAGFDITPKGFKIDVPFDITLKTYVMLLHTDAHARAEDVAEPE